MGIIDNLITDRTQADVTKLKSLLSKPKAVWTNEERSEFLLAKDKGAYNATDLNRVQEAMEYLAERFRGYGYNVPEIKRPSITEVIPGTGTFAAGDELGNSGGANILAQIIERDYWEIGDIPRKDQMDLYLSNLGLIRGINEVMKSTPEVPGDMEGLLYNEANDIEQILFDVDYLLSVMVLNWFYTAEVFCGEV